MPKRMARIMRRDSTLVLLLSWTAGSMDAISDVTNPVFPANMTGNAVLLGLDIGLGHGAEAIKSAIALGGYIFDVAVGVLLVDRRERQSKVSLAVASAVFAEAAALIAFSILTWNVRVLAKRTGVLNAIVALAGAAMGIQSAAVKKLNLPSVVTTYITGTITALTSGFVRGIRRLYGTSAQQAERDRSDWESRLEVISEPRAGAIAFAAADDARPDGFSASAI